MKLANHPPLPAECRAVVDPDDGRLTPIPGYAVRETGEVIRWDSRRKLWLPLCVKTGPGGFVKVAMRIGDRVRELGVAGIVLRAFVGPRPLGFEPLHFPDPDPSNNRLANLRWAPRGTSKVGRVLGPTLPSAGRGDTHHSSMLCEADIPDIRGLYRAGVAYKEIADRYQMSEEAIRSILKGRTWSHVPDPLGPLVMRKKGPSSEDAPLTKLTRIEAAEIRGHLAAGLKVKEIAQLYEVSIPTVRDIQKGRTWKGY